jgi:hypothetical protein
MYIPSGETTISQAGDVVTEAGAHDETCGLQHLGHTRTSLGPKVAEYNDGLFTFLDGVSFNGPDEVVLRIENAGFALEVQALFASDLGDGATRSKVAAKNSVA